MNSQTQPLQLAADCRWLRRSLDPGRRDPYAMCCSHIIRDGEDCVGPFLEGMETPCRLWDRNDRPERERGPAGQRHRNR